MDRRSYRIRRLNVFLDRCGERPGQLAEEAERWGAGAQRRGALIECAQLSRQLPSVRVASNCYAPATMTPKPWRIPGCVFLLAAAVCIAPALAQGAQSPVVLRACDPPFHNQIFDDRGPRGRLDLSPPDAEGTIARLLLEAERAPSALVFFDLARCYYITHQLDDSRRAVERAMALVSRNIPAAVTLPETWTRLPLAGRDVPKPAKTRDRMPVARFDAMEIGIRGIVGVDAVIDVQGRVRDLRVASSVPAHDAPTLQAMRNWQFAPTLVDGKPIEVAAVLFLAFGDEVRAIDIIDVARLFAARGQVDDARGWANRALELIVPEAQAWLQLGTTKEAEAKGDVREPRKVKHVPPAYPAIALANRAQGIIIAEAILSAEGKLLFAHAVQGPHILREAALLAVRQWEYSPATIGGTPTAITMTVTVSFTLN
jgi:TonB family protein